jgi:hypothetical protein
MDHQLGTRAGALRLLFGLTATLAGLDKFFNLLADWSAYVSPLAAQLLPAFTLARLLELRAQAPVPSRLADTRQRPVTA